MASPRKPATPATPAAPAKPARPRRPTPTGRSAPSAAVREGYHHGSLRAALIDASEAVLAERGLEGFSLREVARRSGVSPAAPAHHFGDAAGLLAAVATIAFDGLTEALQAGNARGGQDPVARLREQGVGYVSFALRYPGRFGLMFRPGPHKGDTGDQGAALERSAAAAFDALEQGVRALYGVPPPAPLAPGQWNSLLSIWSVVHGFAHLAMAGQFARFASEGGHEALVPGALAPMLDQFLAAIRPKSPSRSLRRPGKSVSTRRC